METHFYIDYEKTRFLETSETAAKTNRLNWRAEILLTRNRDAIEGKRVLDLASHDGRFSYACLRLGADHVTGIEGRQHLVDNATRNLTDLGYDPQRFTFTQGDIFDYLPKVAEKEFDTILCFGLFYHTVRQVELLSEVRRIQPEYFILDTLAETELDKRASRERNVLVRLGRLIRRARPRHLLRLGKSVRTLGQKMRGPEEGKAYLVFRYESHSGEWATIDPIDVVAWPTKSFIELFLRRYGFDPRQLQWNKHEIKDWTAIEDYRTGIRVSYIARRL